MTIRFMWDSLEEEKSLVSGEWNGKITVFMKETGNITCFQEKESFVGKMGEFIKDSGKII